MMPDKPRCQDCGGSGDWHMSICIHYRKPTDQGEPMTGDIPFGEDVTPSRRLEVESRVDLSVPGRDVTQYRLTFGPYELLVERCPQSKWIEFGLYEAGTDSGSYFALPQELAEALGTLDLGAMKANTEVGSLTPEGGE